MNTQTLHENAERLGIPPRTLDDVRNALTKAKAKGADQHMARLMLNHGRLTNEAREFVLSWK